MTLMSDLPNSLVEEILSRLPLVSMRAVRLTCKEWDTLSKSRRFAKMHIDKMSAVREGESMVIAMRDNNLYLNEDPLRGKFVCLLDKQIKISQVSQCDGLLLCVLEEDDTKVIVWNPYWGQTRSIETRNYHRPYVYGRDGFSYALGYEDKKSCRSYKILRFIDQYDNAPEDQFVLYEIYDFDSGLWRTLDVTPHWRILYGQCAVTLRGNTYWPASHRNSEQGLSEDHIICFDFTSETFGPLLPLPFGRIPGYVTLTCVREEEEEEEKLGVLSRWPYLEFGTWVTAKIEVEKVSWSDNLSVDTIPNPPLFFVEDEQKQVTTGFDFEDDRFILYDTEDTNCSAPTFSYVPSLAQIKPPAAGCKRKQQSDLETQEYDQNRLTLEKRSKELICKR